MSNRLAPIKTRMIERSLLEKGYARGQSRHKKFWLRVGDRDTGIFTVISHGLDEYPVGLLKAMQKQLRLTGKTRLFQGLLDCSATGQQYLAELERRGEL